MRRLKIQQEYPLNEEDCQSLKIQLERIPNSKVVNCILPTSMWFERQEYQIYKYKIVNHNSIVLGYVYDTGLVLNPHGIDIYLTSISHISKYFNSIVEF